MRDAVGLVTSNLSDAKQVLNNDDISQTSGVGMLTYLLVGVAVLIGGSKFFLKHISNYIEMVFYCNKQQMLRSSLYNLHICTNFRQPEITISFLAGLLLLYTFCLRAAENDWTIEERTPPGPLHLPLLGGDDCDHGDG